MMNSLKNTRSFILVCLLGISVVSCTNDNKNSLENAAEKTENAIDNTAEKASDLANEIKDELKDNDYTTNTKSILNETEVDSRALFGDCTTVECSNEKILSFIKDNIKLPNNKNLLDNSLEQVLVVVDENGNIGDVKFVASGNSKGCPACQQAAVDVVGKMNNWKPAMKDGNPVATKMTIPVRFRN